MIMMFPFGAKDSLTRRLAVKKNAENILKLA
jgi:hypothetical protein